MDKLTEPAVGQKKMRDYEQSCSLKVGLGNPQQAQIRRGFKMCTFTMGREIRETTYVIGRRLKGGE